MTVLPDLLAAARFKLSRERPYLGAALWALQPRAKPGMLAAAGSPIGVDPWFRLYYDPEGLTAWSVEEVTAVLYHEVGHLLRDHARRADVAGVPRDGGHRFVWNLAGDLEINDDILRDGMALPTGGCLPKAFKLPDGLFAEEYYHRLMQSAKPMPQPQAGAGACGSGAGGERHEHEDGPEAGDAPGVDRVEGELIRQRVAEDVREHVKSRGTAPGWLTRWAEARLTTKVDWRKLLASLVRRACGDVKGLIDYSYARPGRRSGAEPTVVLPSMVQPSPQVAVVVDTSGSMSERELAQALIEIDGVLLATGLREGVTVLACDADVAATRRVLTSRNVVLAGGGGTDMRVGLEAALAVRPKPHVIICVTDGATPWPEAPLGVPLIVACTQRAQVVPGWAKLVEVVPEEAAA